MHERARRPDKDERKLRVNAVRRKTPDLMKLSRALIELVQMQAEVDAEVEHHRRQAQRRDGQGRDQREPEP